MNAGQALVASLVAHGADRAFTVPGESFLPVMDAMRDSPGFQLVTARHEGSAGLMALADAKLTGRPGLAFVNRGPGAAHAAVAMHTAEQDATPFILFVGHVVRADMGKRACQEIDYRHMFGDIAKAVEVLTDPNETSATVARAFRTAVSGAPGGVVVVLPEDVLFEQVSAPPVGPLPSVTPATSPEQVAEVRRLLARAERPVLVAGGRLATPAGRAALMAAATATGVPVVPTFKYQHIFPNAHPQYGGYLHYKIPLRQVELLQRADLVLAVGTRLGDVVTQGYVFPTAPKPLQALVHVYPDEEVLHRVYTPDLAVNADPADFLAALAAEELPRPETWEPWRRLLHETISGLRVWKAPPPPSDGVAFGSVVAELLPRLDDDAIIVTDAGNFSTWVHRYVPFGARHELLGLVSGSMGLAVPGGVASGLRYPGRQVISFVGDGGFQMSGAELATAVQYGVPLKIFVANNGSYGTIRMCQEMAFPGRVSGTSIRNPDFAGIAEACGALGLKVARPEDCREAVARALAHDGPALVDVKTSLEHISAWATMADLSGLPR